jgi:Mrp family chromosome partitioning ATPase
MICTFYSAERKTGRSMAMANVAELLRRDGYRVVAADWDLEAPGLERLFPAAETTAAETPGIIDLLLDYKAEMTRPILGGADDVTLPTDELERYLTLIPAGASQSAADLQLMPAGRRDLEHSSQYAQRVATFDWAEFCRDWEGDLFLEQLRGRLLDAADLVLIDSSAGMAPSSSVCTSLLADVVIMFCTVGSKSLDLTAHMAQQLMSANVSHRRENRAIQLLVVPARIDYGEAQLLNEFKHDFLQRFGPYVPPNIGSGPEAFWKLHIPSIAYFAYRESLVIERPDEAISEPLVEAYQRIATTLKELRPRPVVPEPPDAPNREKGSRAADLARFRALRIRKTDIPTVFISYARDDATAVRVLYQNLTGAGFKVWLDKEDLLGGQDWESVIEEKIESSDLVLVCLSRRAIAKKGYVQKEVKKTLEVVQLQPEGTVYLIPVRLEACEIPRSMHRFNVIDLFEQNGLAKLDQSIRNAWRQSHVRREGDLPS